MNSTPSPITWTGPGPEISLVERWRAIAVAGDFSALLEEFRQAEPGTIDPILFFDFLFRALQQASRKSASRFRRQVLRELTVFASYICFRLQLNCGMLLAKADRYGSDPELDELLTRTLSDTNNSQGALAALLQSAASTERMMALAKRARQENKKANPRPRPSGNRICSNGRLKSNDPGRLPGMEN